ncbi:MAG: hypothetical protein FD131_4625 [Rhodocyclaceae bacterium]|nr:MAG: hypothetical protein FD131_4625 [Rhodocyclaceae bacterium]
MIELCQAQIGQPVYHVKEPDAPDLYALVSFNSGQADPELDAMTVMVASEQEYEEVSKTILTGRAGLLAWYVENVGYSPDEDIGGLTPIDELIDRVASHLLLRTRETVAAS